MDASHDVTFGNRGEAKQGPAEARLAVEKERVWWQTSTRVNLVTPLALPTLTCVNTCVEMCMYTNIHHHHGLHIGFTLRAIYPPILSCFTAKEHHG